MCAAQGTPDPGLALTRLAPAFLNDLLTLEELRAEAAEDDDLADELEEYE